MDEGTRVAMWSGPRNISTAMMYSFDNRSDCFATDEPLYANYLLSTKTAHPDADEVIDHYETDLESIISHLTGSIPDDMPVWYQKHMSHHVTEDADLDWLDGLTNCFLIRDPREVLLSLSNVTDVVNLWVMGLPQQVRILSHVVETTGKEPPIIDARDVLEDPVGMLSALCDRLEIEYVDEMVSWDPGPRDCDGIWARHWYDSVWKTTGFSPYTPREGQLSPEHDSVLEEAMPLYDELWSRRLGA